MQPQPSGPGKTAPKLLVDFLLFDPVRASSNTNILADVSPPKGDGPSLAPGIGSCNHQYTTKSDQSILPPLDYRPDGRTQFRVAVVCKKCRLHADVHIQYPHASNPCPNSQYPLHHFQRARHADLVDGSRITYGWTCSAPECKANVAITFRLPRIDQEARRLLTDTELLKRRYEAVIREDPQREGIRQASPIDTLQRLRKYIKDALNPEHTRRTFPANNKRFMEAFGVNGWDCGQLLQRFGFTFSHNAEGYPQWTLPQPGIVSDRLHVDGSGSHMREVLEDVEMELLALMFQLANEMNTVNPAAGEGWHAAEKDVERTLAAQGYQRSPTLRLRTAQPAEQLPYYDSLGVLPEFADSLVEFAFDRQCMCDPERRPYYFECLQALSEHRGTEQLQVKVVTLESQGAFSRRDLSAACRQLGLSPSEIDASEDRILNVFHAQQPDLSRQGQEDSRQALYKIGSYRQSSRLINASRQMIETVDEALSWLGHGVTRETGDDALVAIAGVKIADGDEETTKKAISVIAKDRKSDFLNRWLLTGQSDGGGGYQMSVDEALRHLNIEQSLDTVDPSVLQFVFENARSDRPGEQTDKAIATIEQAMAATTAAHSPEKWPVGLRSHGNTCYLNSLLQYYFSITPLRNTILNYDEFKLDTSKHAEKEERVGQRQISQVEIKGGQKFADDLKHLFERMIKAPGKDVKPEEDLVCRAFLEPKDYALLVSASKEESNGQQDKPDLENAIEEKIVDDSAATKESRESDASSVTLRGDDDVQMTDESAPTMETPAQVGVDPQEKEKPTTAPPLPPRRFSSTKQEALEKAQAKARDQQDVTEVHDAIQFRLRSGMTPKGRDARGEQIDVLGQLFKIDLIETSVKDGVEGKQEELPADSSILCNPPVEKTDIYSALDEVFDLQPGNTEGVELYKSIRTLPPLLQVSIPRIAYAKDGRGVYKTEATFKLEDELYLDRYLDSSDPRILPTRRQCWGWRRQLHALRKEKTVLSKTALDLDGPTAVTESANHLDELSDINKELDMLGAGGIEVDASLPEALRADAAAQNKRLVALDAEIAELERQLKDQFGDMRQHKYRLAAVFFHRGTQGHGHYWTYIHDFDNDIWRIYNDETVEQFSKPKEILEAEGWSQGTPTYAVFVRDDIKTEIIQPVCRQPEKPPTPEPSALPESAWEDEPMVNGGSADDSLPPLIDESDPNIITDKSGGSWDTDRRTGPSVW